MKLWERALASAGTVSKTERLAAEKAVQEPQLFPVIFELAEQRLGREQFIEALRAGIYEHSKPSFSLNDASTTLGVIADCISRDHQLAGSRRIVRVISFNADELLREALRRRRGNREMFWRTMNHAVSGIPRGRGRQPVPIYHVHGFLPRDGLFADHSDHRLVFTDQQYWDSGTSQASFANRTMNAALADSHCLFIGLSMTDPNLLRWLALRYIEASRDATYQSTQLDKKLELWQKEGHQKDAIQVAEKPDVNEAAKRRQGKLRRDLAGHFWIRARGDDPTGLITEFLGTRGVETVEIDTWRGSSFGKLMSRCFP